MSTPAFSVIVPLFNKRGFVSAALRSLTEAVRAHGAAELLVVDQGSTDGSRELVQERFAGVSLVCPTGPGTIARARNLGAKQARGAYLCFVDADCVVPADYLARVARVMAAVGADAAGGGVELPPDAPALAKVWHRMRNRPAEAFRSWVSGASLTMRRSAFAAAGGFDETLITEEDVELCARMTDLGLRVFESAELTVVHLDNPVGLGAFFAKEVWHGMGMFSLPRWPTRDLAAVGTLLHTAMTFAALACLATPIPAVARGASAVALLTVIPVATVARRAVATRRLQHPLAAVLLYETYYLARQLSMLLLGARCLRDLGRRLLGRLPEPLPRRGSHDRTRPSEGGAKRVAHEVRDGRQ